MHPSVCLLISLCDDHCGVSNELSTVLCDSSTDNFGIAGFFLSKLLNYSLQADVVAANIFLGLARICVIGTKLDEQLIVYNVSNLN